MFCKVHFKPTIAYVFILVYNFDLFFASYIYIIYIFLLPTLTIFLQIKFEIYLSNSCLDNFIFNIVFISVQSSG